MEVEVIAPKWGTYSKGDIIDMHESTAIACVKSGFVKAVKTDEEKPKKVKDK